MRVKISQIGLKYRGFLSSFVGLSALLFVGSACQFGGSFEEARCSFESDCAGEAVCVEGFCALPHTNQPSSPDTVDDVEDVEDIEDGSPDVREDADADSDPDADATDEPVIDQISLEPSELNLVVGEVGNIVATALDADGAVVASVDSDDFRWTSNAPNIAVPLGEGAIRALSVGDAQITVSYGDVSAAVTVQVAPADAAQIEIFPATITLTQGGSYPAEVRVYDVNGVLITNPDIVWAVDDESVATVDEAGLINAVAAGSTSVIVAMRQDPAVSATADIYVNALIPASALISPSRATIAAGQTLQFEVFDDDFQRVDNTNISWTSSDAASATVSPTGLVEGLKGGVVTIQATVGGIAAPLTADVTILAKEIVRVEVAPVNQTMRIGETKTYSAQAFAADGDDLSAAASFTWTVLDTGVAASLGNGDIEGVAAGASVVVATTGSISGYAGVQVERHPVHSLTVTAPATALQIADTLQLDLVLKDSNGDTIDANSRIVNWTSSNEGVLLVDGSGMVTALSAGSATITALSEGVSDSLVLTVEPEVVVNLAPVAFAQEVTVPENTSLTFNLTAYDPEDDTLTYQLISPLPPNQNSLLLDSATGTVTYTPPTTPFGGPVSFKFKVNDGKGNTSNDAEVMLTFTSANEPPVALAVSTPTTGTTCDTFALDASGSSDAETAPQDLSFQWEVVVSPSVGASDPLAGASTDAATLSPTVAGSYIIKLVVTDEQGASDTVFVVITVDPGADPC